MLNPKTMGGVASNAHLSSILANSLGTPFSFQQPPHRNKGPERLASMYPASREEHRVKSHPQTREANLGMAEQ